MGNTDLHQILRSVCLNTVWKYAVFWKLKHRSRMVLTWEDAYYDKCEQQDPLENKCFTEALEALHGGHYSHDPLGLAVAKMSYHVYSLGEGIVGRVAVSGTHQWIFADKHVNTSCSSFEFCDGWQSQFAAGIRTIVVVAVAPHGVLQLGSLSEVIEDVKVVSHIRDVFSALQDSSVGHVNAPIECNLKIPIAQPDLPIKGLASEVISLDKAINKDGRNDFLPEFSCFQQGGHSSYVFPMSGFCPKSAVEVVNKHEEIKLSTEEGTNLLKTRSNIANLENRDKVGVNLISDRLCEGETSSWKSMIVKSEKNVSDNSPMSSVNFFNVAIQAEGFGVDHAQFTPSLHDSALSNRFKSDDMEFCQTEVLEIPESSDLKFQKDFEKLESQTGFNQLDSMTTLTFTAGCELYEALGPAFLKKSISVDWQAENTEAGANIEMPEGMSSSQLTLESGSENLLEAVVANVCHNGNNMDGEQSFCRSVPSLMTDENMPELSSQTKCTINSSGYSINQSALMEKNTQHCLNSAEFCGAMSSNAFSSTCPTSTCSEQLERSSEPVKNNKKRTRPGESSRPRPRDRQLIQDRIKELRELVPNGGKCSIDSLLERTVKHMLFLQSITKHADKLNKCAESKMHHNRTGVQGSSNYDQGSSWAVEVGSHLKVCSIIVENLNKNGQMLVEMLCEECSHFLEIAEAIRSLGLTILKGVTEAHGDKTWICFVVEGQNNRIMHRMDILWPLVQILQSKSTG
ncbi:hypothetical protein SLE2022_208380 [Rubroshorea leprosula]